MAHVFGEKWKNNLIAREALEPLIFCKGMEHDAKGMEDSRWLLVSTQKILKYSHHFEENSIKRNSLFIWASFVCWKVIFFWKVNFRESEFRESIFRYLVV